MFEPGYWGLFLATFLAATIVPFSSEAMLSGTIYAGYDSVIALSVATFGNWLGGMTSFYLGYLGKEEWISKYLRISPEKTNKYIARLRGKEQWAAFFCWLPFVGDIIAVALGLLKMNALKVAIGMFLGKALRYIIWAIITLWVLDKL